MVNEYIVTESGGEVRDEKQGKEKKNLGPLGSRYIDDIGDKLLNEWYILCKKLMRALGLIKEMGHIISKLGWGQEKSSSFPDKVAPLQIEIMHSLSMPRWKDLLNDQKELIMKKNLIFMFHIRAYKAKCKIRQLPIANIPPIISTL